VSSIRDASLDSPAATASSGRARRLALAARSGLWPVLRRDGWGRLARDPVLIGVLVAYLIARSIF